MELMETGSIIAHLNRKKTGVPNGSRTRVADVKGRCPWPLDDGDILKDQFKLQSEKCKMKNG